MTIEQIAMFLAFIVSLIGSIEYISVRINKCLKKVIKSELEEINSKLKELELNSDKNFLVRFLCDVEQGNVIFEVEIERFYETYERYHSLGGNSYIDYQFDKLKKEGKL